MVTVDARNGRVLRWLNTRFDALGAAFDRHPGAPVGGTRRYVDLDPWLDPGEDTLAGPNTLTFANVDDDDYADGRELTTPDRDGDYVFDWVFFDTVSGVSCPPAPWFCSWDHTIPYSWAENADATAVQQFVSVNRFHDHLAAPPFEFTPANGSFEGDDYLWSEVDEGAELENGLPPFRPTSTMPTSRGLPTASRRRSRSSCSAPCRGTRTSRRSAPPTTRRSSSTSTRTA
jgi:hypothetical protein